VGGGDNSILKRPARVASRGYVFSKTVAPESQAAAAVNSRKIQTTFFPATLARACFQFVGGKTAAPTPAGSFVFFTCWCL
jgi:hypothetical protein